MNVITHTESHGFAERSAVRRALRRTVLAAWLLLLAPVLALGQDPPHFHSATMSLGSFEWLDDEIADGSCCHRCSGAGGHDDSHGWRLFQGVGTFRFPFTAHQEADIREPGPDAPDFPDSSLTVSPGVVYVETSVAYSDFRGSVGESFSTPTLIRMGLWSDFEFRISCLEYTYQFEPQPETSGLAPVEFGFKKKFWEEPQSGWLPGFGMEVGVFAPIGNPAFNSGKAQPTLLFNFDKSLSEDLSVNISVAANWLQDDSNQTFFQTGLQWSFVKELGEDFEMFTTGFVNAPGSNNTGTDLVAGLGGTWYPSQRIAIWAVYNMGLSTSVPKHMPILGVAIAL